ncbi:MAG: phosphatidylserine decarboxylase family protein [Bacteroidales bacterium]|nr:phosphatidylserine decarboxylase family protein [Bacteroidales bacterium]
MKIHREGYRTLLPLGVFVLSISALFWICIAWLWFKLVLLSGIALGFLFVTYFFRDPQRKFHQDTKAIIAPADGEVIEIEKEWVSEFMNREMIRVSILMWGYDVHINWIPASGRIIYQQYHPGRNLIAKHPKASELNERSTIVIERTNGDQLLVRQIAGVLARRVVTRTKPGQLVNQGDELGFIKLGSRMDVFVPLNAIIHINVGVRTIGRQTVLASWADNVS